MGLKRPNYFPSSLSSLEKDPLQSCWTGEVSS